MTDASNLNSHSDIIEQKDNEFFQGIFGLTHPLFCIVYEQESRKTILNWGCGENICCSKIGEGAFNQFCSPCL